MIGLSCLWCDTVPKPTNIAELKTALLLWNCLPQEFTNKAILCHCERDFDRVSLQLMADTLNTQVKYREGN